MTIREFLLLHRADILANTFISKQVISHVINGKYKLNAKHIRQIMIAFPDFIPIFINDSEE